MCGITGFLERGGLGQDGAERLASMVCVLGHRGPDDEGAWLDAGAGVALGHRRLSIIELSPLGHQPMHSADDRWVIIFNGEIYNFATLRRELVAAGAVFRGHSDTEVILAGVTQWGLDRTLARLAGMFAIALWDRLGRTLHLVRDRLGEKPLYYGWQGSTFLFGSELKALRAHPAFAAGLSHEALGAYLRLGYVPGALSIYQGIAKLPPGCRAEVHSDGGTEVHAYWSLGEAVSAGRADPLRGSDDDLADAFELMLREVVREQMVAEVPLGAFLSGGIDSSTVVALMQSESARQVRTFSVGFHEADFNEADHARRVAGHLGTAHTELYVTPAEARGVVPSLARIYDEPFADPSQIPTVLVARLARQHVTVALSGDGGDELMGGYSRYVHGARLWRMLEGLPLRMRGAAAGAIGMLPPAVWDSVLAAGGLVAPRWRIRQGGDRMQKVATLLHARSIADLYEHLTSFWRTGDRLVAGGPAFEAQPWPAHPAGLDPVEQLMYWDAATYLPDDVMVKVDRAAMSTSLETRSPFLDHRVVELAWRFPLSFKVRDGTGKWGMRKVLARHVPRALWDRPKQGFGVPIGDWLRGPLREWASDLLSESRLKREGHFAHDVIHHRLQEHLTGVRNWQYHLWVILMFESWLDESRSSSTIPAFSS